jgi:hypothetical protein
MPAKRRDRIALTILLFAASVAASLGLCTAPSRAQGFFTARSLTNAMSTPLLILVQNPSSPFTLPQTPEAPVSPINPGTLPGTTSAAGGPPTGINPITGLPCSGEGALSVSGAGGLPGTATAPPGTGETLDQIPVGTPPVTSIYGSGSSLGAC